MKVRHFLKSQAVTLFISFEILQELQQYTKTNAKLQY